MSVISTAAPRYTMRSIIAEHRRVNAVPTGGDRNRYRDCKHLKLSIATTCEGCSALLTLTLDRNYQRLVYRISSFGCNSSAVPSKEWYHRMWFDSAMNIPAPNVRVAVRVVSNSEYAILIKETNGAIPSYSSTRALVRRWNIGQAEFVRVSDLILESHTGNTRGKTFLELYHSYLL